MYFVHRYGRGLRAQTHTDSTCALARTREVISNDPGVGRFPIIRPGAPRVYLYHFWGLRAVSHHPPCFSVVIGWRMWRTPPSSSRRLRIILDGYTLSFTLEDFYWLTLFGVRHHHPASSWIIRGFDWLAVEDPRPETPPGCVPGEDALCQRQVGCCSCMNGKKGLKDGSCIDIEVIRMCLGC